ncbi:uncharacterized protein ARMOST_02000 [Armillaria ostoyae]|uniref:Uncharacterized protein n=1 Tax=Armillaria ostoyae TaxID=47428 RepID=A0A284QQR3_ARMOS|nr:uncharacterized protein ARMOST_02000 [Armillaria ostoyae]
MKPILRAIVLLNGDYTQEALRAQLSNAGLMTKGGGMATKSFKLPDLGDANVRTSLSTRQSVEYDRGPWLRSTGAEIDNESDAVNFEEDDEEGLKVGTAGRGARFAKSKAGQDTVFDNYWVQRRIAARGVPRPGRCFQQSLLVFSITSTAKTCSWSFDYYSFHITTKFPSLWCTKLRCVNVEDATRVGWILRGLLAETKACPFTVPRFPSKFYKGSLAQSPLDFVADHFLILD